jgi:hypothetical protein
MDSLDTLVRMRRIMREKLGISPRQELKAIDIRKGRGALWGLGWSLERRMQFYQNVLKFVAAEMPHLTVFAVAIDKRPAFERDHEPRETAWQYALQRVHRFCEDGDHSAMIFPDEGHGVLIKRLMRKMRRFEHVPRRWGTGTLSVPVQRLVEDPNDRESRDSYFVQIADLCAFAAHRSRYVDPLDAVDSGLWDLLGDRRLLKVNSVSGGPPGIKYYPWDSGVPAF